jgi:hypothetical protein
MRFNCLLLFLKQTRSQGQYLAWSFVLASTALTNVGCSAKKVPPALPASFKYQGDFYPAFLPPATFVIQTHQKTGQLKLTRAKSRSSREQLVDSVALGEQDVRFFFEALDSVSLLTMVNKENLYTDGIGIENQVWQNGLHNSFRFSNPKQPSPEQQLVAAVLGLARRKFPHLPHKAYFESVEEYCDFGLPCELTSARPWEVRIHSVIYGDDKWLNNLHAFLQRLPPDQPILIDMTNSHGMAWKCFPVFRAFLARNARVIWVPSAAALTDLQELGVPANHIAKTVAQGRQLVQTL